MLYKKSIILFTVIAFIVLIVRLTWVSKDLTDLDYEYAKLWLPMSVSFFREPDKLPFVEQVRIISLVQKRVLEMAPIDNGIPMGQSRELSDLYQKKHGLCYDRSRAIEKLLIYLGFEVRHITLYPLKNNSPLTAISTPKYPSHAVTEVRTKDGWLIVDSNSQWVSLEESGKPVSVMKLMTYRHSVKFADYAHIDPIYKKTFIAVFGLYSRHGLFYPPYVRLPDINWSEFLDNFEYIFHID